MNINGKFWHKPGHLGMTTDEVKKALKALPTPEAGDAGKAVLVNADADGYELGTPGGGGGESYDMVIECAKLPAVATASDYTISSGSVTDVMTKIQNGGTPKVYIHAKEDLSGDGGGIFHVGVSADYIERGSEHELAVIFGYFTKPTIYIIELYWYDGSLSVTKKKVTTTNV